MAEMQIWRPLRFKIVPDKGPEIGSWEIPNPNTHPREFLEVASDLGFHVLTLISKDGAGAILIREVDRG